MFYFMSFQFRFEVEFFTAHVTFPSFAEMGIFVLVKSRFRDELFPTFHAFQVRVSSSYVVS